MSGTSGTLASSAALFASGAGVQALDIALAYDQAREGCDLVFASGDIQVDTTPVTEMLVAIGCDRRARPSDTLPTDGGPGALPAPGQPIPLLGVRRGCPTDALDAQGRRTGSRMWLLSRAKQTEQTRLLAEGALSEALALVQTARNITIQLTVRWIAAGILGYRAAAGAVSVGGRQQVGS